MPNGLPNGSNGNGNITFFAETTFRNLRKRFGIRKDDRRRHMYVIGKTGMGKSEMLANMIIQDIQRGNGVAVIDPHGELAERMLDFVPSERVNDVVYVNPADTDFPIAFNVMENVGFEFRHLVASGLMGVFKKIWPDVWSARMEYILNNAILALLEYKGSTLLGINRMLSDKEYRAKVVGKITDPVVKAFWVTEFARYTQRLEAEATASIQNKVGQFISNPLIRNIIGQVRSKIDMREVMDSGKILIVNLSKGKVGEDNARLLGAMLVTKIQLAAMSRVDIPEEERRDFYLYVDEFQNFATESFANILSEARKYRLSLILAHQYIAQIGHGDDTKVRDAVFGNVGTIVCFRIGAEDAEFLEREFEPEFMATDLVNIPKFNIYLKLMIDGITNRAFSAVTLPPMQPQGESFRDAIIRVSRERYGTPKSIMEDKISRWWAGVNLVMPAAGAAGSGGVLPPREPSQLFEADCSNCGKHTYVTFEPDGKRPVYCKKCLKEKQQEAAARTAQVLAQESGGGTGQTQEAERPREKQDFTGRREEDRQSFARAPAKEDYPARRMELPLNRFEREKRVYAPPPSREPIGERVQEAEQEHRAGEGRVPSRVAPPPVRRFSSRMHETDPSGTNMASRVNTLSVGTQVLDRPSVAPLPILAAVKMEPVKFSRNPSFSRGTFRAKDHTKTRSVNRSEVKELLSRVLKERSTSFGNQNSSGQSEDLPDKPDKSGEGDLFQKNGVGAGEESLSEKNSQANALNGARVENDRTLPDTIERMMDQDGKDEKQDERGGMLRPGETITF